MGGSWAGQPGSVKQGQAGGPAWVWRITSKMIEARKPTKNLTIKVASWWKMVNMRGSCWVGLMFFARDLYQRRQGKLNPNGLWPAVAARSSGTLLSPGLRRPEKHKNTAV